MELAFSILNIPAGYKTWRTCGLDIVLLFRLISCHVDDGAEVGWEYEMVYLVSKQGVLQRPYMHSMGKRSDSYQYGAVHNPNLLSLFRVQSSQQLLQLRGHRGILKLALVDLQNYEDADEASLQIVQASKPFPCLSLRFSFYACISRRPGSLVADLRDKE